MFKVFSAFAALLIFSILSYSSVAETGSVMSPLKVQYMYSQGSSIYIRFSNGSMDGCHGGNSGRLASSNILFDSLYSQVLTIIAMGGIKGQVLYNVNSSSGNWSDCEITGLVLFP